MLALPFDIVDHAGDVGFAYRENSIAILPGERRKPRKRVVYPFGRATFDELRGPFVKILSQNGTRLQLSEFE